MKLFRGQKIDIIIDLNADSIVDGMKDVYSIQNSF